MTSKIYSIVPHGFDGKLVEVEGDMNRGLPAFNIVGMANKTVSEAKERVRSAIVNSKFCFPDRKVTINLAPADLLKDGSYLDLPIALAVLSISGQLIEADTRHRAFVGELSLDGAIRPVKGIINIVEAAKRHGFKEVFVPSGNLAQAALVHGVKTYGADTLIGLYLHLKSQRVLELASDIEFPKNAAESASDALLDHIRGQKLAKRAMEIAVAGHHNILISGPPGAGKTLLARAAANLLPGLTPDEMVEITKIYSLAGLAVDEIISRRPFRAPHHTASVTSLIGGGTHAAPGEISLAHKGVLFLDEIPEFPRSVLESLRQPLEDRQILISRANGKAMYPADFMLVATMNPCPCGYLGDASHECSCTELQIQNYKNKLSGPLLDRIDLWVDVERVGNDELRVPTAISADEHNVVKNTITGAIERQKARYGEDGVFNSSLSSFQVTRKIQLAPSAEKLLKDASEKLQLSARSYFKTIKVSRTIADLDGRNEVVQAKHIAEALTFRRRYEK